MAQSNGEGGTVSSDELREKIQNIFNDCTSGWLITIQDFNGGERELGDLEAEIINDILELIHSDRTALLDRLEGKAEEVFTLDELDRPLSPYEEREPIQAVPLSAIEAERRKV